MTIGLSRIAILYQMILYLYLRLCQKYIVKGGGFLQTKDISQAHHTLSSPKPYRKTEMSKTVCYRYDSSRPKHCLEVNNCTTEPLTLDSRISRSSNIMVRFDGWFDPIPVGGTSTQASSIDSFDIAVNSVSVSGDKVKVDTKLIYARTISSNITEVNVNLNISDDKPQLFCIVLSVKDVADNVKHARRFFLYDNSSKIMSRSNKPFYISSASKSTNYLWQTHHNDICLTWKNHFYNRFYHDNKVLNPIETDTSNGISGVYEQTKGILPVNGTKNVDGIIRFWVSYANKSNINGSFISTIEATNLLAQSFCQNIALQDGQTYTFQVQAVDIVNNSFSEERAIHIDRSVPHIENIWLVKDGYRRLYVHNTIDLSKMVIQFEAYDSHSGIQTVEWFFGSSDASENIYRETLSVTRLNQVRYCSRQCDCYLILK